MKVNINNLPKKFRQDHIDRGLPDTIESIRADAAYYADPDGPDDISAGLKRSAKATLKRLEKLK